MVGVGNALSERRGLIFSKRDNYASCRGAGVFAAGIIDGNTEETIETLVCPVTQFALQCFRIRVGLNSLRPGFERSCLARELHRLVAFELPVDGFEIFDEDLPRTPINRQPMGQSQEFGGSVGA